MIDLYKHISDYYCRPVHNLQAHELSTVAEKPHVAEIQHASVAVTQHPPGDPPPGFGLVPILYPPTSGGKKHSL